MKFEETYDCIIVGGGVAGLTAAAHLSKADLSTLLLEKNERLGGVAGSFFSEGYIFDVGGTPQYDQLKLLKEFGVDDLVTYEPMGDPAIAMYFPDYTICGPMSVEAFLDQYRDLCTVRELEDLKKILIACTEIDMSKYLHLNQSITESKLKFLCGLLRVNPFDLFKVFRLITQDTESWLRKRSSNPHVLNTLIYYNALTMMYPTASTPTLIFVLIMSGLVGTLEGRWRVVRGGNDTFFEALGRAIERQGGCVRTGTKVSRVLIEDGRAVGVQLEEGTRLGASAVISDIGIGETIRYLAGTEHFDKALVEKVNGLKPSPSWFKIHLGVNRKPPFKSVVNFFIGNAPEPEWWEAIGNNTLPEKTPFLFWCKYLADPTRAPEGCYDIDILSAAPYRHRNGDWDTIKQRERDRIMSTMEELWPGIGSHIEYERVYTPKEFEAYSGHERAGILPVEPSVEQLMKFPDGTLPVENLHCVGATVKGGAGVNGAAFTGRLCATRILKSRKQ